MSIAYDPKQAALTPRPYQKELTDALVAEHTTIVPGSRALVHVATGGGKRMILNNFIAERVLGGDDRALVVAKDWSLVAQLAEDLVARHEGTLRRISVVGDPPDPSLFTPAREGTDGRIVFTTLQTCVARRASLGLERFDFVLLDESHWAERAKLQKTLYEPSRSRPHSSEPRQRRWSAANSSPSGGRTGFRSSSNWACSRRQSCAL